MDLFEPFRRKAGLRRAGSADLTSAERQIAGAKRVLMGMRLGNQDTVPAIERRRTGREAATGSILISPGNEGVLVDWSAGGFALESTQAVRVGETYRLRWSPGALPRPLAGVVRWSRLRCTVAGSGDDVAPVFRSGFELVELEPAFRPVSAARSPNPPSRDLRESTPSTGG